MDMADRKMELILMCPLSNVLIYSFAACIFLSCFQGTESMVPTISVTSDNPGLNCGTDVVLECIITGPYDPIDYKVWRGPLAKTRLIVDGSKYIEDTTNAEITNKYTLTVSQFSFSDVGAYTCEYGFDGRSIPVTRKYECYSTTFPPVAACDNGVITVQVDKVYPDIPTTTLDVTVTDSSNIAVPGAVTTVASTAYAGHFLLRWTSPSTVADGTYTYNVGITTSIGGTEASLATGASVTCDGYLTTPSPVAACGNGVITIQVDKVYPDIPTTTLDVTVTDSSNIAVPGAVTTVASTAFAGHFLLRWTSTSTVADGTYTYNVGITTSIGGTEASLATGASVTCDGPPAMHIDPRVEDVYPTILIVSWEPGYHGGPGQIFVIQYSTDGETWTDGAILDTGNSTSSDRHSVTVDSLSPGTLYSLRIHAYNQHGLSPYTDVINVTTLAIGADRRTSSSVVGPAVGGSAAALVVIALVVGLVVLHRKGYYITRPSK